MKRRKSPRERAREKPRPPPKKKAGQGAEHTRPAKPPTKSPAKVFQKGTGELTRAKPRGNAKKPTRGNKRKPSVAARKPSPLPAKRSKRPAKRPAKPSIKSQGARKPVRKPVVVPRKPRAPGRKAKPQTRKPARRGGKPTVAELQRKLKAALARAVALKKRQLAELRAERKRAAAARKQAVARAEEALRTIERRRAAFEREQDAARAEEVLKAQAWEAEARQALAVRNAVWERHIAAEKEREAELFRRMFEKIANQPDELIAPQVVGYWQEKARRYAENGWELPLFPTLEEAQALADEFDETLQRIYWSYRSPKRFGWDRNMGRGDGQQEKEAA